MHESLPVGWVIVLALALISLGRSATSARQNAESVAARPVELRDQRRTGAERAATRLQRISATGPVWLGPGYGAGARELLIGGRLDPNRSTAHDLALLPGIGPSLSRRIGVLRARRGGLMAPEDLLAVPGLGERRVDELRPWLRFDAPVSTR